MRAILLALPILLGCGSAPVTPERDPVEPLSSGVTLYVLETFEDFLDDFSPNVIDPGPHSWPQWIGTQALEIILRAASRGRGVTLVRRQQATLREGEPLEFHPDTPVHYLEPDGQGRLRGRQHGELGGFHLRLTGKVFEWKYLRMELDLRYRHGKEVRWEVGIPELQEDRVGGGTHLIPFGGSLLWRVPGEGRRVWVVLLHVASVEPRGR